MNWGVKRRSISAATLGLLLAAVLPASAQSTYLHAHAQASVDYIPVDPQDPGQQVQTVDNWALGPAVFPSQTAQASAAGLGGIGSGSSRADFGSLGVYALASTSNPGGTQENGVRQSAGSAMSSWSDLVTVGGLTNGTLVDIQVNMVIDVAAHSINGSENANTAAILAVSAHGKTWCSMRVTVEGPQHCGQDYLPLEIGRNALSFVVQAYSGTQTQFGAHMQAGVAVATYSQLAAFSSSAQIDAVNSAHSYYTVLTPNATLTFASGHDYSLPAVPEPATWASLLAGLGVLGLKLRRRRTR